jgi:signal peptidase I
MKIFQTIFFSFFTLILFGIALLFVVPLLPLEKNIEIKIVESGSMEPKIPTGSLVFVLPTGSYKEQDVITFNNPSSHIPTTHRIVAIDTHDGVLWFTTKGDANEEVDTEQTPYSRIIGEVVVSVPYAGFILDFARQPLGFSFLIVLPSLLIIFGEIEKIWCEVRKNRKDSDDDTTTVGGGVITPTVQKEVHTTVRMIEIGRPIVTHQPILVSQQAQSSKTFVVPTQSRLSFTEVAMSTFSLVLCVSFIGLSFVGSTVSYFNDGESSGYNTLTATALDFTVVADGSVFGFQDNVLDDADGAVELLVSPVAESVNVQYEVTTKVAGGSVPLCTAIQADASVPALYSGPLLDLSVKNVQFDTPWSLSLSLADGSGPFLPDEMCSITITYTAWDASLTSNKGYFDEESVTLVFTAPQSMQSAPIMFSAMKLFVGDTNTEEVPTETTETTEENESTEQETEVVETEQEVSEDSENDSVVIDTQDQQEVITPTEEGNDEVQEDTEDIDDIEDIEDIEATEEEVE